MSALRPLADLMYWIEEHDGMLMWTERHGRKPTGAPSEFKWGEWAYCHSLWPTGRAKAGLGPDEFWFRGRVYNGDRLIELIKLFDEK